ncbi:MAG: hypothetical protein LBS25_02795 [Candidatus Symbiothrix sp.]|jgi:hypothetical protein|nr:hypothetical protein [Candidatus Symbiothrix sp.]
MDNHVQLINQLLEIKQKIAQEKLESKFERNFNRIFSIFEEAGYLIQYPMGEKYSETRSDYEAAIIGQESNNMVVSQVIKPVIYRKTADSANLLQKGIVVVEKA